MIKLEKIILEVSGKKIELSLDEARELKTVLKDLLGNDDRQTVYVPTVFPYPYVEPYKITPLWIWSDPYRSSGTITISSRTYGNVTGSLASN